MLDLLSSIDLSFITDNMATLNVAVTDCAGMNVPKAIVNLVATVITIIQVVVPILLIIWGMLDFAKGVVGGDEDKIKAGQKLFIQRIIAAVIVFLVVVVVRLVVGFVGDVGGFSDGKVSESTAWGCVENFINGVK